LILTKIHIGIVTANSNISHLWGWSSGCSKFPIFCSISFVGVLEFW
jgi:hypothetical protein